MYKKRHGNRPAFLEVVLNGEPHQVPAGATVADLVPAWGATRAPWPWSATATSCRAPGSAETRLGAGDRLEVVHFVQGG